MPARLRTRDGWVKVATSERFVQPQGALSPRLWFPGMTCSICGTAIRQWQQFNWDHDIPISRGGPRGRRNKRHAHLLCNSVKGNRHPFSLRAPADREAIRVWVKPSTYAKLQQVWAGG